MRASARRPLTVTMLSAVTTALVTSALVAGNPAHTQEEGEGGSTTTSITLPEPPTTSSSTTTTLPPDPEDPGRDGDAAPAEVPVSEETVPPSDDPARAAQASQLVHGELRVAKADLLTAEAGVAAAEAAVRERTDRLARLRRDIGRFGRAKAIAIEQHALAKDRLEERAADALRSRGETGGLALFVNAETPNEVSQRTALDGGRARGGRSPR